MPAILKLNKGSIVEDLHTAEPFFEDDANVLHIGTDDVGGYITIVKLDESNDGSLVLTGDVSADNATFTGNVDLDGNLFVGGNITLGSGGDDTVFVGAPLSGSLVPDTTDTYDLGSVSKKWDTIYANSASFDSITATAVDYSDIENKPTLVSGSSQIDHDQTFNYVNTKHIDHSILNLIAGDGLSGGGILTSSRTLTLDTGSLQFTGGVKTKLNEEGVISGSIQVDLSQTTNYEIGIINVLDSENVFSSSAQVNADTVTNFDANVKDKLNMDNVHSGSYLGTSTTDNLTEGSNLYYTDARAKTKLNTEGVISGSSQVNADNITNFDTNVKDKLNEDGVISGSSQVDVNNTQNFTSFSSSVDGRLDTLEGPFSQSIDSRLDSLESTSSSLDELYEPIASSTNTLVSSSIQIDHDGTDNYVADQHIAHSSVSILSGNGLTGGGNITATRTLTLQTGSVHFAEGVKGVLNDEGIVSQSLLNDLTNNEVLQLQNINTTTISVDQWGYIGDLNQGLNRNDDVTFNEITASGDVLISGDLTILGTATEIQTSDLYITDKLITIASGSTTSTQANGAGFEIDGANVSLTWYDPGQTFMFDARVTSNTGFTGDGTELTNVTASLVDYSNIDNLPTLVSSSAQINITQTEDYTLNFKNSLDNNDVVSSSAQINADTITNFDSNVGDFLSEQNVHSGSYLGSSTTTNLPEGTNLYYTDARVKTKLNTEGVVSGSSQVDITQTTNFTSFSSSLDSRLDNIEGPFSQSVDSRLDSLESTSSSLDELYEPIASSTNTLVSGSSQIDLTQTTNYESGIKDRLNAESVISSSVQVNADNVTNFDTNVKDKLNTDNVHSGSYLGTATTTNLTEGSNLYYTDARVKTKLNTENVISSSIQVNADNVTNFDTNVKDKLNTDGVISGSSQLTASYDTRYAFSSSLHYLTSSLGTSAYYNTTASIADDPNSVPTTKAVYDELIAAGAGDIQSVNSTLFDYGDLGLITTTQGTEYSGSYGERGDVVIALDTGSLRFTDGVDKVLNTKNVISSSVQVNADNITNFDTNVKNKLNADNVHSGSYLGTATTDNLTEGSNLYYTEARVSNNTDVAANTVHRTSDGSDHTFIDQDVTTTSRPNFAGYSLTSGSAPTYGEGKIWYDETKHGVTYFSDVTDVQINMGQELLFRVTNNTGATIPNGTVVYPDPTTTIGLADARFKTKSRIIAVTTHDIPNGEEGWVTKYGQVGGLDTSAYSVADTLYLGQNGQMTTEIPLDGGYEVVVAIVDIVDTTNGVITVDPNASLLTVEVTDTNGFPNTTDTTLSFDDGTRTLSIAPTGSGFHYYILGDKYEKTSTQSVIIDDVTGEHIVYFDGGTLNSLTNPSSLEVEDVVRNKCFVSYLYWNSAQSSSVIVNDERHGISMSPATHVYLHTTRGAQYLSGLAISDIVIGNGNSNSHAQFGVESGTITDEDLSHTLNDVAGTTGLRYLYRTGSAGDWASGTNSGFSFPVGPTPLAQYNEYTGTTWQLTEVPSGDYFLIHVFASSDISLDPIAVLGTEAYSTIQDASAGVSNEISVVLGSLAAPEFVPVASVMLEAKTSFNNSVKTRVVQNTDDDDYTDWTVTEISQGAAASNHNTLTNLQLANTGVTWGHISDVAQTIYGLKTYNTLPQSTDTPTADADFVTKLYGDNNYIGVTSFEGRSGSVVSQAGDYTAAEVTNAFDKTVDDTDDITEGTINRFYSSSLFDADFASKTTDDLIEGSNLYYTDARVKTKLNTENVISSSIQVNADNVTNFDTNVLDYINSIDVISGSSQVNADTITNFDTNVKDKLNTDNVHSGSYLGTATTTNLTEGSNLYYTEARVKTKLNTENVISSSVQVDADNITNFDTNVKDKLNTDNVHSGSYLGTSTTDNLTEGSNLYYTDARVKTKLNTEGVISGSDQLTSTFDNRYVNLTGDETINGNKTFNNNVVISGDLSVGGTTTTTNSNEVNIGDNIINLNYGFAATFGGLYVSDSTGILTSGSIIWKSDTDKWYAGPSGSEVEVVTVSDTQTLTNKTIDADSNTISNIDDNEIKDSAGINATKIGNGDVTNTELSYINSVTSNVQTQLNSKMEPFVIEEGNGVEQSTVSGGETIKFAQGTGMQVEMTSVTSGGTLTFTNTDLGSSQSIFKNFTVTDTDSGYTWTESGTATAEINNDTLTLVSGVAMDIDVDSGNDAVRISHSDTSTQASVNGSGRTYIQDVTLDTYGHVTGLATATESSVSANDTTITISAGSGLSTGGSFTTNQSSPSTITINHSNSVTAGTASGGSGTLTYGESFTIPTVTYDAQGHVTAKGTTTYTLPASDNTFRPIHDTPVDGATTTSISSNWAYDHANNPTAHGTYDNYVSWTIQDGDTTTYTVTSGDTLRITAGTGISSNFTADDVLTITNTSPNVTTNLSTTHNASTVVINSSDGTNATINAANGTTAGILTAADYTTFSGHTSNTGSVTSVDVNGGNAITVDEAGPITTSGTFTVNHADTSTQTSLTALTGANVVSDIDLDTYGHVTNLATRAITLGDLGYTGDTNANNYVHPTHPGDDFSVDTTALTGATVVSDIDINVTTDTLGHVTDANGSVATRTLTLGDLGYTGATNADNYSSWTIQDGDTTTYTITSGDTLQVASGTGISSNFTADDVLTITNTAPNVTTNLSTTHNTTTVVVNSSDGTNATINGATTTTAGVVTNGTQSWAGAKTFTNTTASTSKDTGAVIIDGGLGVEGDIHAGADIVAYSSSDIRLKDNVIPISNPTEKLKKIRGVTWDWNEKANETQKQIPNVGVIAQEVEEVFPQLVNERSDGYKAVDYEKLVAVLIETNKELLARVEELEKKVK